MLFVVFLQSAERGAQSVKATADSRLPTSHCQPLTADCRLLPIVPTIPDTSGGVQQGL